MTAIIYSPTSEELQAGLEEEAVMCTSLHAEKVPPSNYYVIMSLVIVVLVNDFHNCGEYHTCGNYHICRHYYICCDVNVDEDDMGRGLVSFGLLN